MIADHIHSLICSTYGHTLVLFTSYHLMSTFEMIMRMGQELKTQNFEEPKSATQHLIF